MESEEASDSRCKENCDILREPVTLQAQKSSLLGFSTHANCILEMNVAKSNQVAATFLDKLAQKLMPPRAVILKRKKAECRRQGLDFDGWTNMEDKCYSVNRVEETHYSVDQTLLTECFPMQGAAEHLPTAARADLPPGKACCHVS